MDIYDMRRAVIANLIESALFRGSQAAFATATDLNPSYVTRMLSAPGTPGHKRIGEDLAIRLEAIAALKLEAGALLDPKPVERAKTQTRMPTDSEWAHLQNLRDMSDEDKQKTRDEAEERSKRFRSVRKQILESVGIRGEADPDSVERALGNVPKVPTPAPLPPTSRAKRAPGAGKSRPAKAK